MRIVQIMPDFRLAGAENMVATLALELKKRGQDVHVISLFDYHSVLTDRMEQAGIPVYYFHKKHHFDIRVPFWLFQKLKELKPDVIHTHRYLLSYVVPAAKLTGTPRIVHTVHTIAEKEVGPKSRILHKLWFHHFGVVPVALSPLVRDSIVQQYGLPQKDVPSIYNGVDLSRCHNGNHMALTNGRFSFLHVGRLSEQKNHMALIEAFSVLRKGHPKISLDLLGEGNLYEQIQKSIQALGLQDCVRMLGAKDDVFPFYAAADAFVLPSLYEGMPITLIEAMGSGLPIVTSAVGGIPDMLEDGVSGLLCAPDPQSIAACMERLLADPALCVRLGEVARERAKMFSAENMADGYLRVYQGRD